MQGKPVKGGWVDSGSYFHQISKKIILEISEDIDQNNMDLARIASAGQTREGRVGGWWLAAGDKWTAGPASRQPHTPLCQAGLIMLNTKDSYGHQVDDNKG